MANFHKLPKQVKLVTVANADLVTMGILIPARAALQVCAIRSMVNRVKMTVHSHYELNASLLPLSESPSAR